MNDFKILTFKVKTNKSESKILKFENEIYYINLAALPFDNQANNELINFVSKEFKINKENIKIITGKKSTLKRVKIDTTNNR